MEVAGNTFHYAELNVRHTGNADRTLAMVKRAVKMGYDTVAINIDIGDIVPSESIDEHMLPQPSLENTDKPPPKKKPRKDEDRKGREQQLPEPFLINESQLDLSDLQRLGKKFRQFSRITFTLNDATVIHNIFNNPRLRRFDLVAVRPGDVSILTTLTRKTDAVDIITMNPETHVSWLHKSKFMEMIRAEGVGFEFTYASALLPANRRACLHSGRFLIRGLRGRGVVVSSGASSMYELRAPVDVMNMSILWGIQGDHARLAISGNAKQILLRAEARRTVRGALHVSPLEITSNENGVSSTGGGYSYRSRCYIPVKFSFIELVGELMRWLENLRLWSAWKIRRIFRLQGQTIAPIQWGEPLLTTFPSATLDARLNSDRARKLRSIVYEVKTISMLTRHFPSKILDDDWLVLLDCQTRKQRLDYLKFLRNREREREKDMEKKRLKEISSSLFVQETKCEHSSPLYYPTAKLAKEQRRQLWQRVANAYRCGAPTLVIDCRFLPLLSPRGAELTSIQLKYLISENRDSSAPWQLYFANFDLSNDKVRRLKRRHLSVIDSSSACSPVVLTIDYTHMFGRERIVYLSPDAEEELEDVDDENVYVLGGIVDRVVERGISRQASLEAATSDRVCCKRLPLDKYVKWKSGNKFLTLTAVSSILRDVNNSGGDWESALRRNIPVRNIRSAEEKCAAGRQLHEKIRHFDNQLLQILDREIGQEPL
ncbi:hypothetical protein RB195_002609 [Necator americanus]|uniref:SAM-dependent MTase TRM10-type domain-containing protein n=1 Tax=Necator americanus TaxID=51031 RepID=A0ABR1DJU3_NECAM